jgi:hypothetical protein
MLLLGQVGFSSTRHARKCNKNPEVLIMEILRKTDMAAPMQLLTVK